MGYRKNAELFVWQGKETDDVRMEERRIFSHATKLIDPNSVDTPKE